MRCAGYWSYATFVPLKELNSRSDVISINCALTEKTYRMVGPEGIAKTKDTAVIILSARGEIVDE